MGLFTTEDIKKRTYRGETHFKIDENRDWLRTPLGGSINHSIDSNAEINLVEENIRGLTTKRDIGKDEKIMVFLRFTRVLNCLITHNPVYRYLSL